MKTHPKIAIAAPAFLGAMALGLAVSTPAAAQSRYDRDRDDDRTEDALIGAAVGALAGAVIGNGDGAYIAGGALAGAAIGASSSRDDCGYYRGGRCYRNRGHWEREHGINSRDGYGRWDDRRDRRDWRRDRRDERRHDRDYRYDRRW